MHAELRSRAVGPWPMNTYVVICPTTQESAVVDPGAEPDAILDIAHGTRITKILLTHAHPDHVGALDDLRRATHAPVYLHPLESEKFGVAYDVPLSGAETIEIGEIALTTMHTPGHTPGMISFGIDRRVLVGDTLFVGGPGRTWSPQEFATTMETLHTIVFAWSDATEFYPGHGPSGTIGQERPAFDAFVRRGWPADLCGDVTWVADPTG